MSEREIVTVTHPGQLLAVTAQILGFHPVDSLVILGLGGGPTARVDAGPVEEIKAAMDPALVHWSRVVVLGYGTGRVLVDPIRKWLRTQGVEVVTDLEVDNVEGVGQVSGSSLDARVVRASRAELEAEAWQIDSVHAAEVVARAAYRAGDGARAWAFYDRAVALADGKVSPNMADLDRRLRLAIDPRDIR